MPTDVELAYIAGIVDGEGYIGVYKTVYPSGRVLHLLTVGIKMCDPEAIGLIVDSFGGCNSGYENEKAFVYRVVFTSKKAYEFLKAIRPFLRVKAEQADWAIEFYEECRVGKGHPLTESDVNRRDDYAKILRDLKGWQPWEVCHS